MRSVVDAGLPRRKVAWFVCPLALGVAFALVTASSALAEPPTAGPGGPGWVLSHQKISDTQGGFTGTLEDADNFGINVAALGDLDSDGIVDLVVGAQHDDDGGDAHGAVWVLFLNAEGTVKSHQKISDTEGGFTGTLDDFDEFGRSVASLGDLDGDGVADLAVGAFLDDDGGNAHGAVWILFLNANGTVNSHQKISDTQGGFTGILENSDLFGISVATLGDLDGDGVGDLAVGAPLDDDGGILPSNDRGAVWILFLNTDGTVKAHQKISSTQGGFTGTLDKDDQFGVSVASLDDLDGDGVADLAVGAFEDDDGGENRGAVWLLFLNTDGTVKSHQKISDTEGGFTGTLDDWDLYGNSMVLLGDLDGDGVGDLAVGAYLDDDGGGSRGAVWILFLNTDGTVKSHQKISDREGGFTGMLDNGDLFAFSVAALGDLGGDGVADLAVGAANDDDGGFNHGAVWVLFLDGVPVLQDSDNDGIPDDEDACPDSDLSGTIVIDGCDSGVGNLLFEDGCTMADLIAECADGAANHGAFVSCVAHLTNEWSRAGLITGQEKGAIRSCAAQADIPSGATGRLCRRVVSVRPTATATVPSASSICLRCWPTGARACEKRAMSQETKPRESFPWVFF
ncbi:MAG: FG-GAP repeat protein [Planctomycetes bacterium]|nr:FG-GAP repeat protein [Planctomycetota bacterium]